MKKSKYDYCDCRIWQSSYFGYYTVEIWKCHDEPLEADSLVDVKTFDSIKDCLDLYYKYVCEVLS